MHGWLSADLMSRAEVKKDADQRDMRSGIFRDLAPIEALWRKRDSRLPVRAWQEYLPVSRGRPRA